MRIIHAAAILATLVAGTPATAAPFALYPVQTGGVLERFRQGVPTVAAAGRGGVVQITPVAFDHGRVSLAVAIYNAGLTAIDFGIEDIAVSVGGRTVPVLRREALDHMAKSRATWSTVGTILATSLVAGVAAGVSSGYRAHGRIDGHRYTVHGRDGSAGTLAAVATGVAGTATLTTVQDRLDAVLDAQANEIVQTTTIDPGAVYGGRIVLGDVDGLRAPYDVVVTVAWNGQAYPFTFRVTKPGVGVPPPFTGPRAPLLAALAAPVRPPVVAPAVLAAPVGPGAGPVRLVAAVDPYAAGRAAARAAVGDDTE